MSKHTPGPWTMRLSDNATPFILHGGNAYLYDIDDLDHLICVMPAKIMRDFNSFANAKLIAAAPEMLDALNDAPVPSKYHGARGFETNRFFADYEAWMEKRRDAIAKAEGKVIQ